jgi:tRNA nucleotidyltransferase/poly(A) polymerase
MCARQPAKPGTILFLTGDAVRDLTSGHAVRDLEVAVHGNALKLKKTIEKLGGKVWGEDEDSRTLYLCFPGTVRVDLVSTHRVEFPNRASPSIIRLPSRRTCAAATSPSTPWPSRSTRARSAC